MAGIKEAVTTGILPKVVAVTGGVILERFITPKLHEVGATESEKGLGKVVFTTGKYYLTVADLISVAIGVVAFLFGAKLHPLVRYFALGWLGSVVAFEVVEMATQAGAE